MNEIEFTLESYTPIKKLKMGTFCRHDRFGECGFDHMLVVKPGISGVGVFNFDVNTYNEVDEDTMVIPCDAKILLKRSAEE